VLIEMMFIALCSIVLFYILYLHIHHLKKLKKEFLKTSIQLTKAMEDRRFLQEKLAALETNIANNRIDDPLTGLPSRQTFQDRLVQTLDQCKRYHFIFAIMMLDLDGFRVLKNVLGLEGCQDLLKEVAARIQSCIRPMDTVCRIEGSEFFFIVPQLAKPETAAYVAKRLLEIIAQPFLVLNQDIFLTASIGISVYPNDGEDPHTLIQNADQALLQAKSNGSNTFQFYQKEIHGFSQRELSLSSRLHHADTFQDFLVYYQPWVNVESKKIVCMEAFLHWKHPEIGLIAQQDFLRLAEKSSNILAIGEWLLRSVCQQLQKWRVLGFHPESIAINVSPRQLENPHFTYQVSKILQEMKLAPAHLILELSEIFLVNKISMIDKSLHLLKRLGVQICVNHFGAGNISLQNLKSLPIHFLKMDSTLISDVSTNIETEAIVKMIIALANTLKIQVIAGGVENIQQKRRLIELGTHVMQGDMICPPITVSDFTATVEKKIMEQV
jgi:diguanylate cyclase (GGDEF)-like protein